MKKLLMAGILFCCVVSLVEAEEIISIGSPSFLPFNGKEKSETPGYMIEVMKKIFEPLGYVIDYKVVPLKRGLKNVAKGKLDATLAVSKTNASNFIFPKEEFGSISDTFYVKKGTKWRFVGMDSLKSVKLGGLLGYGYGPEIDKYIQQNKKSPLIDLITGKNTGRRNIKKLLKKRMDVLISNVPVMRWEIQKLGLNDDGIVNRGSIGNEKKIYVAFSPAKESSKKYAKIFSKGIQKLRDSGELKNILDKYNQKDWKPSLKRNKKMKVVFAQKGEAVTLDPAMATDLRSFKVIDNIYEGLVRYKDDSTEIEPALATSWNSSNNGKTWTFNLRKDVVFHDGTPFNAEAVVYNFQRQLNPEHPLYKDNFGYADFTFTNVENVKAIDNYTLEITLAQPYTPFLYNLAMPAASRIISPKALNEYKDDIGKNPVGTGPFKFSSWNEKKLTLEKNKQYWGEKAYLDELVFLALDNSKSLSQFKTGNVNMLGDFETETAIEIEEFPKGYLLLSPVMHVGYLAMNTEKKPFDNVDVRKAINLAINKKKLVNNLFKGFAIVSKTSLPPSMWGHNSDIVDYEYNIDTAKKLLAKAGYPNGFEVNFWVRDKAINKKLVKSIKADLEKIGVTLNVETKGTSDFFKGVKSGAHQLAKLAWYGDNGDPDNFLYVLFDEDNTVKGKASNRAFLKDKELHEIFIKAQQSSDKKERTRLYEEAQKRIWQLAPWVHLFHKQQVVGLLEQVRGVVAHPTGTIRFHKAWIE